MSPGNLNQDGELDLPSVHPTLPVEMKKNKLSGHHTCRQFISGACLLLVILAMVAAFSATIILGQKFIIEIPPTDNHNLLLVMTHTTMPAPTPLVNFDHTEGKQLTSNKGRTPIRQDSTQCTSTTGAMASSSPTTTKSISSVPSPTPVSTSKTAAAERIDVVSQTEERKLNPSPHGQLESITTLMTIIEQNE